MQQRHKCISKGTEELKRPHSVAGAVAGLVSHLLNARLGRKWCMVIAGAWFFIGAVINAAAQDLAMLYIGRIFLGFGVGFANQSVRLRPTCVLEFDSVTKPQYLLSLASSH